MRIDYEEYDYKRFIKLRDYLYNRINGSAADMWIIGLDSRLSEFDIRVIDDNNEYNFDLFFSDYSRYMDKIDKDYWTKGLTLRNYLTDVFGGEFEFLLRMMYRKNRLEESCRKFD